MQAKMQEMDLFTRNCHVAPILYIGVVSLVGILGSSVYLGSKLNALEAEMVELKAKQVRLLALIKNNTEMLKDESRIMQIMNNDNQDIRDIMFNQLQNAATSFVILDLKLQIHEVFVMSELIFRKLDNVLDGVVRMLMYMHCLHILYNCTVG